MRRIFFLGILIFTLGSCKKQNVETRPEIDKTAFLAPLLSSGRYWRFEELIIEQGSSRKEINLFTDTTAIPYEFRAGYIRHLSFQFENNILSELITTGPYGNVPYLTDVHLSTFQQEDLKKTAWRWNTPKQTVELDLNKGIFEPIIESVSPNRFKPSVGYLDNTFPAAYRTLNEAVKAATPERIKIDVFETDPKSGLIKYTFVMRGAWIKELLPSKIREKYYRVLY